MSNSPVTDLPRVLVVDLSANFGGTNARVLALMKKFPTDRVGLATIRGSMIAPELEESGYSVYYLAAGKFDPHILFRMVQVIRDHGYQVIDTQNPQSKFWGSFASFFGGAKLISTLNSWYMNEHPKYSLRWLIYSVMEFATNFTLSRYIVVSGEIRNAMIQAGIPQTKIDLIYNAIDLDVSSIRGSKKWLLEKYELPYDSVICLAAGRLAWSKAHDDLINAVSNAREKNAAIYCMIAGDGALKLVLKKQIDQLGAGKYILLLGHVDHDELLAILKSCDIYVMPSRTEGTPVALLEAMALEKPIVASDVGGIPELVTHQEQALLVKNGSVEALKNALLRIAGDAELASRLGLNARERVFTNFTLSRQFESTKESYIKALQESK